MLPQNAENVLEQIKLVSRRIKKNWRPTINVDDDEPEKKEEKSLYVGHIFRHKVLWPPFGRRRKL